MRRPQMSYVYVLVVVWVTGRPSDAELRSVRGKETGREEWNGYDTDVFPSVDQESGPVLNMHPNSIEY